MSGQIGTKPKSRSKSHWIYSIISGVVFGFFTMAVMMYIAWEHNAQSEIHSPGKIDWGYWSLIGFSWFIPVFFLVTLVSRFMLFLVSSMTSGKEKI
jgi:mannose/fructose/N-acetylgalactosamine-specific phosphotransferase system component IIC